MVILVIYKLYSGLCKWLSWLYNVIEMRGGQNLRYQSFLTYHKVSAHQTLVIISTS